VRTINAKEVRAIARNRRFLTAINTAQRELTVLDEKLYLQVFAPPETQRSRRAAGAR
jgi:hypothetical protein